jgi:hypothetical protein
MVWTPMGPSSRRESDPLQSGGGDYRAAPRFLPSPGIAIPGGLVPHLVFILYILS